MPALRRLTPSGPAAADWVLRLALGAVLLYASWGKLLHPADFALLVQGYHILPPVLVNPVAIWLPWAELALGLCLVTGFFAEGALLLAVLLLATFWTALGIDFLRGIDVACGCFSTSPEDRAPMRWYLVRDGGFLLLALAAGFARHLRLRRAEKMRGRLL